jgi:uracil-DNA glycosylase family 4
VADPAADPLDLIRDLRAALADLTARGVRELALDLDLPTADRAGVDRVEGAAIPASGDLESTTVGPTPGAAMERPAPLDRWSALARESRAEGPRGAGAMAAVREELGDCRRCVLCRGRTTLVFGVGRPDADLVIVGEGPGEQEDLTGEPFVGPAGQMLDKMLENVLGLPRSEVYILNTVKCRPPGNRNPTPEELAACRPFLEGQLRAIRPKVLLVLGGVAYKALLETEQGITRARGRWHTWRDPASGDEIPVMPTFHPAYLLRTPDEKRKTFDDLKALRARYDELGGRRGP